MNLETMTIEELDYGVHVVTINNPPANTLSAGIQRDLLQLLEEVENNQAIRAMVFKSANPKIFIAGADLGSMGSTKESVDIAESSKHVQDIFNRLEALKVPTIAAINGHALGGGCEFVLACDFRIMGQGTIGLTEASLGLLPGAGGTQRMTRLVGGAKARELMYLSKRLKAEQAAAIGLITEAVSPEEVEEKAISLATTLAQSAVGAIGLIKESILAAEELSLEQGLLVEREAFAKTFTTGEVEEGIRAFFEKRPPNFLKPVTNQ
ncbi:enoyl-CoA hydratase/isomerase family protein [Solibacillus sp. FSL K6-4121]|uniref:enoyl-CoA hydratase/isomerase family protein n=1 Tax=Solibacillus sp. FSL K6-4121 TaxID=2921505 RepID=UPI0030F4FFB9